MSDAINTAISNGASPVEALLSAGMAQASNMTPEEFQSALTLAFQTADDILTRNGQAPAFGTAPPEQVPNPETGDPLNPEAPQPPGGDPVAAIAAKVDAAGSSSVLEGDELEAWNKLTPQQKMAALAGG